MTGLLGFPAEVNEFSARFVAGGVVLLTTTFLLTGSTMVLGAIAAGFVARVISGPTLSPLGQFVTRVVTPTFERATGLRGVTVPGPPKRFAQSIGATLSLTAVLATVLGMSSVGLALVAMIAIAASLEAFLGYCLGCTIYGQLMRHGILAEDACVACNDISLRASQAS